MQLPDRVTSEYLLERVDWLERKLGVRLLMLSNSYHRKALYLRQEVASPGAMLTPGYISNRELACWMSGVWMTRDNERAIKHHKENDNGRQVNRGW